jgi:hypothetical protein
MSYQHPEERAGHVPFTNTWCLCVCISLISGVILCCTPLLSTLAAVNMTAVACNEYMSQDRAVDEPLAVHE